MHHPVAAIASQIAGSKSNTTEADPDRPVGSDGVRTAFERHSPTITLSTHFTSQEFSPLYDVFNAVWSERRNKRGSNKMAIAAGLIAVVSQLFQSNDHTSAWLAFALSWIACALLAIASSSLVFRVAEARKHINQQRTRRTRR
jgi:hypothetical protein